MFGIDVWLSGLFNACGLALMFAMLGELISAFDSNLLGTLLNRLYVVINNPILMAVPLFVFMDLVLDKSKAAEQL